MFHSISAVRQHPTRILRGPRMIDIATLTLNPAIDISTSVPKIEPIHKLRCTEQLRDPGGGGINVARVIRRLGGDVLAIYPIGGITGDLLQQLVAQENV